MTGTRPIVIAHRGASHDAPENTLEAFRLAWEQGADAIEGDFRLTADRRIVCIHDATTARTGDRTLRVSRSRFDALRRVDVGAWKGARWRGASIPSLEEVLACVPAGKRLFIELKSGMELVPVLGEAVERGPLDPARIVVMAFSARIAAEARRRVRGVDVYWISGFRRRQRTAAWFPAAEQIVARLRRMGAQGFASANHPAAGRRLAAALKDAGLALNVWTVDSPSAARRYAALGADALTTNRPDRLRAALRDERPRKG